MNFSRLLLPVAALALLSVFLVAGCENKKSSAGAGATQGLVILKVSAKADGALLLDGKPTDVAALDGEMSRLEALGSGKGSVWYYREHPEQEPPPQAMRVVEMVIKHKLAISMSSKAGFSDYVDDQGVSRKRD
jgi:hypothetical protein